jgi:hypothetical protein
MSESEFNVQLAFYNSEVEMKRNWKINLNVCLHKFCVTWLTFCWTTEIEAIQFVLYDQSLCLATRFCVARQIFCRAARFCVVRQNFVVRPDFVSRDKFFVVRSDFVSRDKIFCRAAKFSCFVWTDLKQPKFPQGKFHCEAWSEAKFDPSGGGTMEPGAHPTNFTCICRIFSQLSVVFSYKSLQNQSYPIC